MLKLIFNWISYVLLNVIMLNVWLYFCYCCKYTVSWRWRMESNQEKWITDYGTYQKSVICFSLVYLNMTYIKVVQRSPKSRFLLKKQNQFEKEQRFSFLFWHNTRPSVLSLCVQITTQGVSMCMYVSVSTGLVYCWGGQVWHRWGNVHQYYWQKERRASEKRWGYDVCRFLCHLLRFANNEPSLSVHVTLLTDQNNPDSI